MVLILAGLVLGGAAALLSTTSMAAEQAKPIILTWSAPQPEIGFLGDQYKWYANEFEKRAGGRVRIKIHWDQSLAKYKDALPAVQNRTADIAFLGANYHLSQLPLYAMIDTIYNCHEDYVAATLASIDTAENEPNVKAELERQKIVLVAPYLGGALQMGFKKCINSLQDVKGMAIRTQGGIRAEFLRQLGANPVPMVSTDMYEALRKGTIDAWADGGIMPAHSHKIPEVAKCIYMINSGTPAAFGVFMNLDVFKSLPKDIQEMISKLNREFGVRYAEALMEVEPKLLQENEKKHDLKIMYPSPEDQNILFEAGRKANEIFVKQQESAGHTAAADVVSFYSNRLKKYEDERTKKK
jgi:TRAP-type C4-dicarboxylate transport system substrate-binding protein